MTSVKLNVTLECFHWLCGSSVGRSAHQVFSLSPLKLNYNYNLSRGNETFTSYQVTTETIVYTRIVKMNITPAFRVWR